MKEADDDVETKANIEEYTKENVEKYGGPQRGGEWTSTVVTIERTIAEWNWERREQGRLKMKRQKE